MYRIGVISLLPELVAPVMETGVVGRAAERGLVALEQLSPREFTTDRHRTVDYRPYGGGPGMVLMPEPVVDCVEAVQGMGGTPGHLVYLSPQGRRIDQQIVGELAAHQRLVLLCGRYEGIDQRVIDLLQPDELSIGDFILGGGEVAAMVVIDAVVRLVPGVLGDDESNKQDSFSGDPPLLEFPQYTRPREFRGMHVPEVLMSGNHVEIARWRKEQKLKRTRERRADLLNEKIRPHRHNEHDEE